jgi:hypothetical protein
MAATFVAFSPGEGNRNPVNYSDQNDVKFYKMMAKPSDIKLGGKGENMKAFLEGLIEHGVVTGGMDALFAIPDPT